jgi:hypothetical protein
MNILTVNLLFSTLVFAMAARLYILPKIDQIEPRAVLLPILLLHALRHLGLMFLAPGAVYAGIPTQFTHPAAFGDFAASLLAIAAVPAVAKNAKWAWALVWIFNIEGTLDLFARPSRSPRYTRPRLSWGRPIGSPRFGFPLSS